MRVFYFVSLAVITVFSLLIFWQTGPAVAQYGEFGRCLEPGLVRREPIGLEGMECIDKNWYYRKEDNIQSKTPSASIKNKKNSGKTKKSGDGGRAPYANGACVKHEPSGTGKVDWDYVRITNNCVFPVQVLSCYYKPGQDSKCSPSNGSGWGSSSTIKPGGHTTSIATTPDLPWMVSYYVCNMSGVKKHSKLCLLPKQ